MAEDLRKAPPALPPDAFRRPAREAPTPFDVQSSAPPPVPARRALNPTLWMDRHHYPLVAPEHAEGLEQDAAVREFGQHLPRHQAESEAYGHYRRQQHAEGAAHHLRGMRAAAASGDNESARKHHEMYKLHSHAMGHNPNGPVHPDVQARLSPEAQGRAKPVVRFKATPADLLAIHGPHAGPGGVTSSAPAPAMKAEAALRALYAALGAAYGEELAKRAGEEPTKEVKAKDRAAKASKGATTCPEEGCGGWKPYWAQRCRDCHGSISKAERESRATAQRERKLGTRPCTCDAYSHPHRTGGGKCPHGAKK